jgi:hypothetical protein
MINEKSGCVKYFYRSTAEGQGLTKGPGWVGYRPYHDRRVFA